MLKNRRNLGIVIALVSAVNFAFANTLAGVAYQGGSDPLTMATIRYVLPAVLVFFILQFTGNPLVMTGWRNWAGIALGLVTVVYNFALLKAIELLPVSIAVLIFYLFPILTAFFLAILGWGRLTLAMVISAVLAFVGIALALGVQFEALDKFGMVLALISAVGLAVVSTISNHIMRGQDARQGILIMSAVASATMIVISFGVGEFNLPDTGAGWAGFMGSHVLYAAAMIGFYYAISMVGAAAATFFSNLEPIIVVGAGYLLLGQLIAPAQMVGVAIVVGALIYAGRSKNDDTVLELAE